MKKIGILGTGTVGKTVGTALVKLGYEVKMGSRSSDNALAKEFSETNGSKASNGTFSEAAEFGEILFNCTLGMASIQALNLAGKNVLKGKILIDLSNPLDFSKGMPPSLSVCNTDSLGEQIQKEFADLQVVKTLNIVNCEVMVNPSKSGGEPTMFICGNAASAKEQVLEILHQFGWKDCIDLGDISNARGMEMLLPLWVRTYIATKNGYFGFKVIRQA
ncbi:MAG: NAD(P)-binding domain-containing protein [Bacteroidetes bacterium]|nr:NAD(P)-binding domain-containing protein [Bacteroidota bacterium]MBK9671436.1 NAD(P)-binding domain-containing protein [Bacteroidota bacterium]MBK9799393.1 NAD(P)-binding domain-containing protein [Bacteroidota bacterium]